jgi:hypothetical protein
MLDDEEAILDDLQHGDQNAAEESEEKSRFPHAEARRSRRLVANREFTLMSERAADNVRTIPPSVKGSVADRMPFPSATAGEAYVR